MIYLVEELGDARLRATQLKQHVAEALDLINKSDKKDHFYEVAAHLMQGIPDTLFKLDKALDASAMAAAKMDYEEVKQGLRPEKADELERALEDVRLRYLDRRSVDMDAKSTAEVLEKFASVLEAGGRVPAQDMLALVSRLERGAKKAAGKDPSEFFRAAAAALRTTVNPSRLELAQTLRRVLADTLSAHGTGLVAGAGEAFQKVNPKVTDEQVEEINRMHEKHKDLLKTAVHESYDAEMLDPMFSGEFVVQAFNDAFMAARIAYTSAMRGNDRMAAQNGLEAIQTLAMALNQLAPEHGGRLGVIAERVIQLLPTVRAEAAREDVLQRGLESETLEAFRYAYNTAKAAYMAATRGNDRMTAVQGLVTINNLSHAVAQLSPSRAEKLNQIGMVAMRLLPIVKAEAGRTDVLQKTARFEEGKPADPTENMSDQDADEWEAMTEEHGDNFKTATQTLKDKAVINAFLDHKEADGNKLYTDGEALQGHWMGGSHIAEWVGDKIEFRDTGSKSAQLIQKTVMRMAPKNWIKSAAADEWEAMTEEHTDQFKTAQTLKAPGASGKYGYIAFYRSKTVEVYADSTFEAQEVAAKYFKARKRYEVDVMLAEKDGKPVVHTPVNASSEEEDLFDQIRPGSRVTISTPRGQKATGRAVMRGSYGWVLNMGGSHGTPGIATPENIISVSPRAGAPKHNILNRYASSDAWEAMTEEHGDNFKSAKLMPRQEAILKKYVEGGGGAMMFEDLPSNVRKDLSKVKDQETLHSDADRWLGDNNNPHLRSKWASSSDAWKA